MEKWRLLDLDGPDPYRNIAIEEATFQAVWMGVAPSTVRLWRNPNSVVVGRHQSVGREVNIEACLEHDTAIVRRFTGGGSVYHDLGNLNWTFVSNRRPVASRNLFHVFGFYGKAVVEGLREIGVYADFKHPNGIQVNNRKISGLALCAREGATLCHGTLLVSTDLNVLRKVLKAPRKRPNTDRRSRWVESRWSRVTSLQRESDRRLSVASIKESIVEGIQGMCKINLELGELTPREETLVERLYESKYSRIDWNLKM